MTSEDEERGEAPAGVAAGDYFVVVGADFSAVVSTSMARHIEACLDVWPRARWINFVDRSGSRWRVRARQVEFICQSTTDQRKNDRDFLRALREERKADRWYDD